MDEFPSMYSRPLLSRSNAPLPSTKTSCSYSAAHHSRMSVNGCQTNRLSQSISSSVFHSVISVQSSARGTPCCADPTPQPGVPTSPSDQLSGFRWKQRPRSKRAVAGIFARGFLLTLTDPPTTVAHNRSSQHRPQFSLETATRGRTLWLALRVCVRVDSCPSMYVALLTLALYPIHVGAAICAPAFFSR